LFGQKFFNLAFCSYLHHQDFNWASVPGGRFQILQHRKALFVIGRFPGFWKWEAVLNQNGQCELPDSMEADKYFIEFVKPDTTK
jgi:hypothetical protein